VTSNGSYFITRLCHLVKLWGDTLIVIFLPDSGCHFIQSDHTTFTKCQSWWQQAMPEQQGNPSTWNRHVFSHHFVHILLYLWLDGFFFPLLCLFNCMSMDCMVFFWAFCLLMRMSMEPLLCLFNSILLVTYFSL